MYNHNHNHFARGKQMFYYPPKITQQAYRKNIYDQTPPSFYSANNKHAHISNSLQMPYGYSVKNIHRNEIPLEHQLRAQIHKLKNKNISHPGYKIRPSHDVYQEDIQLVHQGKNGKGSIYVGNLQAAENLQTLKRLNIGSLLTACKGVYIRHSSQHVPHYLYIPGQDHELYNIADHFPQAISFIKNSLQKTNILVHCMAGISRSISLVLAYLMRQQGMSFQQAYSQVKRRRRIMNPNKGFVKQLKHFQKSLFSLQKSKNQQNQIRRQVYDLNRSLVNIRNPEYYQMKQRERCKSPEPYSRYEQKRFFMPETEIDRNIYSSSAHISANEVRGSSVGLVKNLRENNRSLLHQNIQRGKFFSQKTIQNERNDQAQYNNKPNNFINKDYSYHQGSSQKVDTTIMNTNYKDYKDLNKQLQQKIQAIKQKYQQYTKQLSQSRYKKMNTINLDNNTTSTNSYATNHQAHLTLVNEKSSPIVNRIPIDMNINNINIHRRLNNPPSENQTRYYYQKIKNNKNSNKQTMDRYERMGFRGNYQNYHGSNISFGEKIRTSNLIQKERN